MDTTIRELPGIAYRDVEACGCLPASLSKHGIMRPGILAIIKVLD